jgi:antitoxin PrlF
MAAQQPGHNARSRSAGEGLIALAIAYGKATIQMKRSSYLQGISMVHSTVTKKGQTTIPGEVRAALHIKPGDRLEYDVEGDHATIRVSPGTRAVRGALASNRGRGMTFSEIRQAAARVVRHRRKSQ